MAEGGNSSNDGSFVEELAREHRSIAIKGLDGDWTEEDLFNYFRNEKYGGGEVEHIVLEAGGATATVVFNDPRVVCTILDYGEHTTLGDNAVIYKCPLGERGDRIEEGGCNVLIEGMDPSIDEELLLFYLQKKKYSGGGPLQHVQVFEDSGSAIACFKHSTDAQEVIARGRFKILDCDLVLSPYVPEPLVQVSGITDQIKERRLRLLLEAEGEGDVADVQLHPEEGTAVVTFDDQQAADRVVIKNTFTLAGCNLTAEHFRGLRPAETKGVGKAPPATPTRNIKRAEVQHHQQKQKYASYTQKEDSSDRDSSDDDPESFTVEAHGVKKSTSAETVKRYFSSRKRSGGGKVESMWYDEEKDRYAVTFTNRDALERVVVRNHVLEGAKLSVSEIVANNSCQSRAVRGPLEPKKIIVRGLPEKLTRDSLVLNLEGRVDCEVDDVIYGLDPSVAVVIFSEAPDFKSLQHALVREPVEGCMLGIERIPQGRSVQVNNIGGISADGLTAYFGSTKSGGSGEPDVTIHRDDDCAVVTFDIPKTAENVMKKERHRYEEQTLSLYTYYEGLGIIPVGHDTSQPCVPIPADLIIQDLDPNVVRYLREIPKAKTHAEQEMRQLRGTIDWDHPSNTELRITCDLKKDDEEFDGLKKNWSSKVKDLVLSLTTAGKVKQRKCLMKIWTEICLEVEKLRALTPGVALISDGSEPAVYVVGPGNLVDKVYAEVDAICNEIEKRMDHLENTVDLAAAERNLIKKTCLADLRNKYQKVRMALTDKGIELAGTSTEILGVQNELTGFLKKMGKRSINVSTEKFCFLKTLKAADEEYFVQNLKAVWDVKRNKVTLFGLDDDLDTLEDAITRLVKEANIAVTDDDRSAVSGPGWQKFSDELPSQAEGPLRLKYRPDASEIHLVALDRDFDHALEELQQHIRNNAFRKAFVDLKKPLNRMVAGHMKNEIAKIEDDFKSYNITIQSTDDSGFNVSGLGASLQQAISRLKSLTQVVISDKYTVSTPAMPSYFTRNEHGQLFLKAQEDKNKVVIHWEDPEVEGTSHAAKQKDQPATIELEQVLHYRNVTVKVMLGDITRHQVDAIVNAANSQLKHSGGLAKAVAERGGPGIQKESDDYVKKHGIVIEGRCAVTGPGNLPCKKIIHAVGPHWSGGQDGEDDLLSHCVYSHVMQHAIDENVRTIAIPAISSGIYGFPLDVSTSTIVEAIRDFLNEAPSLGRLSEIHLFDIQKQGAHSFASAVKKYFQPEASVKSKQSTKQKDTQDSASSSSDSKTLVTKEGITVTMPKGGITKENVDMMVNTVPTHLGLGAGAVSSAILQAAGNVIQKEVSQKKSNGLKEGEHVTSSGGNLSVEMIFHAALCNWNKGSATATKMLESITTEALDAACSKGFTSIALPAMGTGNLQFPRDVVAETMFNSVVKFSRSNPNSTVKDVRFVLYDKDQSTIQAFERRLIKIKHDGSNTKQNVLGGSQGQIQICSVQLQVTEGDITRETTDAIVNGTNSKLDLSGGKVSQALVTAAGGQLLIECSQKGGIGPNGVAVTGAGSMAAKNIIHIDVQGINDGGDRKWKEAITKCLKEADSMGLSSLTFPALGTGVKGIPANKMAVLMMEAIADFSKKKQSSSVTLVRVVVFEKSMLHLYLLEMDKATKQGSSLWGMVKTPFSLVGQAYKGFKGFMSTKTVVVSKRKKGDLVIRRNEESTEPTTLEFTILGLKQSNIDTVKSELDRFCSKESKALYIQGDEYYNILRNLSPQQLDSVTKLGPEMGVRVIADIGRRVARLHLQGLAKDVHQAEARIKEMLHQFEKAMTLVKYVQWEYKEGNSAWQQYSAPVNKKLEQARTRGDSTVSWDDESDTGLVTKYTVDLDKNLERGGAVERDVRRKTLQELPTVWTPKTGNKAYELVPLDPTEQEYIHVSKEFQKTCTKPIVKIERVQNDILWRRHKGFKDSMESLSATGVDCERRLWHGTSPDAFDSINTNGFNRIYCGKNATRYGEGVYFAVNSKYSAQYASPDAKGESKMYYARVLTGQFEKGENTMKTPPSMKDPANPYLYYDSTVNDTTNPTIFVIYNDNQAYPDYIVTFGK